MQGRSFKQLVTGSPCSMSSISPLSPSSYVSLTIIAYFLTWNLGGAASDCARVFVYDTAKRRMQHVFTVLFSVCPMPELRLRLHLPLYMLELSLKRLAILLDCAVVLKTRRIAPVCFWGGQPAPPSLSQPFPLHSSPPGQAEIYAHMLSTVFALKRECRGQNVGPFFGVGSSFFSWQRHAKGCCC